MRLAIICPYPQGTAPGQRFRYEQYLAYWTQNGVQCDIFPFLDEPTNNILYIPNSYFAKITGVLNSLARRVLLLPYMMHYDAVLIYREACLVGYPWFEWILAHLFRKKIILDFDDAIWIPQTVSGSSLIARLRNHQKTEKLCRWASRVSCGNQFLCQYASQFNRDVRLIPTTIDTQNLHNKQKIHTNPPPNPNKKIIIGWTGSLTTMPYLQTVYKVIEQLSKKYPIQLNVISNKAPNIDLSFLQYMPWQKTTEIDDLLQFDIGIMPMTNGEWEQGKCGFKALQYMALAIPAVVSPVGVNAEIVQDGINGYYATTPEQWYNALEKLILSAELRTQMGKAGRQTIEQHYSVESQKKYYLDLILF